MSKNLARPLQAKPVLVMFKRLNLRAKILIKVVFNKNFMLFSRVNTLLSTYPNDQRKKKYFF